MLLANITSRGIINNTRATIGMTTIITPTHHHPTRTDTIQWEETTIAGNL
jgi:hypothetical protein